MPGFVDRIRLFRCKVFLNRAYILEQNSLDEMKDIIKLYTCIITLFLIPCILFDFLKRVNAFKGVIFG